MEVLTAPEQAAPKQVPPKQPPQLTSYEAMNQAFCTSSEEDKAKEVDEEEVDRGHHETCSCF
jgi:hypothetical protein